MTKRTSDNNADETVRNAPDNRASDLVTLGFVRGVAPSRWQERWHEVRSRRRMQLVPLEATGDVPESVTDMTLVRTSPETFPAGSRTDPRVRHAVLLYEEAVALVVDSGHELAGEATIEAEALSLVKLLDHPGHAPSWPAAEPWLDPEWRPKHYAGALELVASGLGGMLMPLPLARHTITKKQHSVVEVTGDIEGTRVFAAWHIERDDDEMQELMGVLRGRTSRSSR